MNKFLFLLLLSSWICISAQEINFYGLEFNSNDYPLNQRSSLTLTPDDKLLLKDNFTLEFELCFRETIHYGPIVSIRSNEFESQLLFIPNVKSDTSKISLIIKKSPNRIDIPVSNNDLASLKYIKVLLNYDLLKGELKINWDNKTYKTKFGQVNSSIEAEIYFGRIRHFGSDTPKINLREIKLSAKNKLKHHWALNEVEGEIAHDKIGEQDAFVENPNWILKSSYHWKKIAELGTFPAQKNISHSEVNFLLNNKSNQINLVYKDYLYSYNTLNGQINKEIFAKPRPHLYSSEIYNPYTDELLSHYKGRGIVSSYNPLTKQWSGVDTTGERVLHHYGHNLFINPLNGDLMMMNGYGWHLTKNALQKYDKIAKKWVEIKLSGDFIPPRHAASLALIGDSGKFILFGGEGNESGKQEEGYRFLRDLFIIDLNNYSVKKIGEINSLSPNLMPLTSAHYDQSNKELYIVVSDIIEISKPKRLYRISLEDLSYEIVSDPVQGGDINWFNGIVFSERNQKFYMISNGRKTDKENYFDLFELNFPPLAYSDYQKLSYKEKSRFSLYLIITLLSTGAGIIFIRIWRQKKSPNAKIKPVDPPNKIINNSIFLFGDFQLFNRNGKEITKEFSPKLKQIFLLLLMRSYNGTSNGISIEVLSTYLWPELDSEQTKNNRNVSLSKLRSIISQLDTIEIINEKNTLKLTLSDNVYCDFLEFLKAMNSLDFIPFLSFIKEILSRGELLQDLSYEWLDGIKVHFIQENISKLKSAALKNNLDNISKLDLADSILLLDSVNEDGLSLKVKTLNENGDHQLAKLTFEHFKKEYKRLYAEDYKKSFSEYCN
ncbi:MAG: hypothetical protein KF816_09900 [Melioribacteraceae bacterium]|nr:hypothetical protein [Melioribacteraceae bacterium]